MASYETLLLERRGRVALITINRPAKLNALNIQTRAEGAAALDELREDEGVRVVVITGAGEKAFVAGADIGELAKQTVVGGKEKSLRGQAVLDALEGLGKPVLAAINGYAFGGGLELALACHLRYAASTAKMGLPEVGLGIIPGYGGTQRLPRIVGRGRALELILSGSPVDAAGTERIGLVNRVFEPAELQAKVREVAAGLLQKGPVALSMALEAVLRGTGVSHQEGQRIECDLFGLVSSTADMREGLTAFLEKRKPVYRNA